jgi:hypothetical protein
LVMSLVTTMVATGKAFLDLKGFAFIILVTSV